MVFPPQYLHPIYHDQIHLANVNELGMFGAKHGQKGLFGIEGDLFETDPGAAEKNLTK
jgi:hypothetical protein